MISRPTESSNLRKTGTFAEITCDFCVIQHIRSNVEFCRRRLAYWFRRHRRPVQERPGLRPPRARSGSPHERARRCARRRRPIDLARMAPKKLAASCTAKSRGKPTGTPRAAGRICQRQVSSKAFGDAEQDDNRGPSALDLSQHADHRARVRQPQHKREQPERKKEAQSPARAPRKGHGAAAIGATRLWGTRLWGHEALSRQPLRHESLRRDTLSASAPQGSP